MISSPSCERVGFGGGCHWCTEAVFQALRGISRVDQGWIASMANDSALSEAVLIWFDPGTISLETLIEIHLRTHASTSDHAMRGKYRSAVYVFNDDQGRLAKATLARSQEEFDEPLVTRVLPFSEFKLSDERFRNYYATDPSRPFCQAYIDPKLVMLRKNYSVLLETAAQRT